MSTIINHKRVSLKETINKISLVLPQDNQVGPLLKLKM